MKISLPKFTHITFLLSLLLIPSIGLAQEDKAHNSIESFIENNDGGSPTSPLTVLIDEDFSSATGVNPPAGWTQNIITGDEGIDLWHFDNPGSRAVNPPMSSPTAIFDSYFYSNNGQPENVALESPSFTADAGASVILELDQYFVGNSGGEIFIEIWNGSSWITVFSSTTTLLGNPQHKVIDISDDVSGIINSQVRFRWTGNFSMYWIIDNIQVYSADPPPDPASVLSPANGAVDVDINTSLTWEAGNGSSPTGYRIYFGTDGGGITPPINVENNTDMLLDTEYLPQAPLTYNTTYYWMVVPYNDAGDASGVPIWSFTVMEDPPVTVYPYSENFEGSFPPQYYIRYTGLLSDPVTVNPTNSGWEQADWRNTPNPVNKAAKLNISGTSVNQWLMTTLADVGSGISYQLEFDLTLNAEGTSDPPNSGGSDDRFAVIISTDAGVTWSESNILKEWNNNGSPNVFDDISSLGEHVILNLSDYSGMIQLGFYGESLIDNADNDLMIDNLEIVEVPPPAPFFTINPGELDFGPVGIGNFRTLQVQITNTGDEDLILSSIIPVDEEFTVSPGSFPLTITAGNKQLFDITFSPTVTGQLISSIEITHNAAGSPVTYIVQGTGTDEGPTLSVSPASLNFGLVSLDAGKNMTLTVSNTGLINELQITDASIEDSGFTVSPSSANIAAGENQIFTVTFSPASAETYSGNLIFTSNDPASPHTILLTGKGAGKSGLLFQQDTVCQLEDNIYTSTLQLKGLDPLGEKVQAIQFRLTINKNVDDNTILTFRNIKKGSDAVDESWVLEYNLFRGPITGNGASVDSVYVLLYNLEQDGGLDPATDYNDLFTIEYRIANLPALNDTLKSSMIISNASATTSEGYPVDITSADNLMTVLAVNRVSSRGDVNGDGYIDILDLIMVVDHIIGKDSLSGESFTRADISPWIPGTLEPEPDGIVNVQDLSLIQNIILTGFYPNDNPIGKSQPGSVPKIAGEADAEVKAYITGEGITLYVNSKVKLRGAQIEFGNISNSVTGLNINTDLGQGYYIKADSSLRILLYDRLAGKTIPPGEHFMADMPFRLINPENVVTGRVVLVDADRHRLEKVEIEIINESAPTLPLDYLLFQNYPNPFNPSTAIKFEIPNSCYVTLKIYNMLGEEVRMMFSGQITRGTYTMNWDGSDDKGGKLSSGTYIYRLTAEENQDRIVKVKKMILLK